MATLTIDNLTVKYFYGAKAVDSLSLQVADGEKVALLSAEEGGKTTVLKCIAGLVPAESGKIKVGDRDISDLKTKDRNICLILDDGGVMRWHSLFFHLNYPLKIRKVPKPLREKRIAEVGKEFNLTPIFSDLGRMLYPDDIIRMCFARAKLRNAPITLIDDVFSLASKGKRKAIFKEMLPHIAEMSGGVLFATTEREEAFSVADRVVVLNFGQVQQIGTPRELIDYPANLFVERLISPLRHTEECDVKFEDNRAFVDFLGKKLTVDLPNYYIGKKVFVSALLVECDGKSLTIKAKLYEDGSPYAYIRDDIYIKLNSEIGVGAEIDFEPMDIRIYDYSTEKSIHN